VPERPTSWQTFLQAHWGAIAGADFFTTEVWTWRGLMTYYTVFVIDLASRRVHIVGSTPHPDEVFMQQVVRTLTAADDGLLVEHRVPICDRDTKWSAPVRVRLGDVGIRAVLTPYRAPNANTYADRFVRSIKEECLNRVIPFGERHLRRTIAEYVEHYHRERNHQGLDNALTDARPQEPTGKRIRRRPRLGGLLNYYERAARRVRLTNVTVRVADRAGFRKKSKTRRDGRVVDGGGLAKTRVGLPNHGCQDFRQKTPSTVVVLSTANANWTMVLNPEP
jgi:integrase-like protein